ncbi:MAG: hypothetical protein AAF700_08220 [Pseudomonadota bacterium]
MRAFALAIACIAGPAFSCGVGEWEVFDCSVSGGKKTLRICSTEEAAIYRFGVPGKDPELELFEPIPSFDYQPWPGIGRYLNERVTFTNDSYGYTVYSSFDRLSEGAQQEGGVIVIKGDAELAHLRCDAGSVSARIDLFGQFKSAAGQCWDYEARNWTSECPAN